MQLMSIEDLAVYLGDSKRTIYKYIANGDCPPYIRISAKNIKFDRADVDAWLESKKVFPGPGGKKMSNLTTLPWTPRAQRVMKASEKAARLYKAGYAGTGQILLSIVEVKECLGAVILRNLKIDKEKIREVYEQLQKDPNVKVEDKTASDKQNLTDSAQKTIQCASDEALRLGHEYVGAEHLLAGILLVGDGWGHRILTELGVTLEQVLSETAKLIVSRPVQVE
ncbi:MAG: helix-turn-helix domain-containing protein [Planctomycetes bacterium]|nr:helix-turn-helix domain-containing protein [Planctomycetota bacterium]